MRRFLVVAFLLASSPAFADPPQTAEQRIATQLGNLMILNASQAEKIEQLQGQIAVALARVKELEARLPKDETPPKP